MSKFGRLLRKSNFAAFNPEIKQVFSANSPESAKVGDYGFKYDLPRKYRGEAVSIRYFDTPLGDIKVESASMNPVKYAATVDNFSQAVGLEVDEHTSSLNRVKSVEDLTQDEFNELLEQCKHKLHEYQEHIKVQPSKKSDPAFISSMLGLSASERSVNDDISSADNFSSSFNYIKSKTKKIHGYPSVKGRILNPVFKGYAVGIAGHVCFLPNSPPHFVLTSSFNPRDRSKVHDFYLDEVRFNSSGSPHIVVSLNPVVAEMKNMGVGDYKSKKPPSADQVDLSSLLSDILEASQQSAASSESDGSEPSKLASNSLETPKSKKTSNDSQFLQQLSSFLDTFDDKNKNGKVDK